MVANKSAIRRRQKQRAATEQTKSPSKPEGVYVVVGDVAASQGPVRIKKHRPKKGQPIEAGRALEPERSVRKVNRPHARGIPVAIPVQKRGIAKPTPKPVPAKTKPSRVQSAHDTASPATRAKPKTTTPAAQPKPTALYLRQDDKKTKLSFKQKLASKTRGLLGLLLVTSVLVVGWVDRDSRSLFADEGLGYALGIVGSLLILTLLLYPLRKRWRFLKIIGPVKNWFKTHMTLGVVGPVAILYHSNFQLGSLNSSVALFSMLLVASSGLIGRFLYTKIHHGLFGRKKRLKELLAQVKLTTQKPCVATKFVPHLMQQIQEYDRQVLVLPKGFWKCMVLPVKLSFHTHLAYFRITHNIRRGLARQAKLSSTVAQHRRRMFKASKKYVDEHLRRVRRVAEFGAYERLFSLWHKVHLPFFFLLLITAIAHVVAVHWYSL